MSMAFATKLREMQEQIALIADAVEEIQHALAASAQKQETLTLKKSGSERKD